jgi:polysaccharide export outer membrane protein
MFAAGSANPGSIRFHSQHCMNISTGGSNQNAVSPCVRAAVGWRLLTAFPLLVATMLLAGCQSPSPMYPQDAVYGQTANPAAALPQSLDARTAGYAASSLAEGDVVTISFQYSTNFDVVQKIALDGMLNLETVGPVKAAGRTVVELQTELARLYKPQVKDDVVTVKIIASSDSVYLSGAVIRPGKIPMERPMTAIEAIMEAGGFDPNRANLSDVIVLRLEQGKQKSYILNLKRAIRGQDEQPFYLKPFDIVHVPTKTFNF